MGLFCKRTLLKRLYPTKETCNFKEPTNHSHTIQHLYIHAPSVYVHSVCIVHICALCMYMYVYIQSGSLQCVCCICALYIQSAHICMYTYRVDPCNVYGRRGLRRRLVYVYMLQGCAMYVYTLHIYCGGCVCTHVVETSHVC